MANCKKKLQQQIYLDVSQLKVTSFFLGKIGDEIDNSQNTNKTKPYS